MTRKELIKAIDENEDAWSCPEYSCDMPEKEGNSGKCCLKCAEKQLKAYEDKIRAKVLKEVEKAMYNEAFKVSHEEDGLQKWDSGNWIRYKLFEKVMQQLKEQNNG